MTDTLLSLIEQPTPAIDRSLPLERRFELWRERHPEVVAFIARRALAASRTGARRLSAKALVEEARSASIATTAGKRDFLIDNSMTALLARHLVAQYPELDGKFELRRRRNA